MLMCTSELIPGKNYEVLGAVRGSVVRAKHIGKDILAGFKSIVGGEVTVYTELLEEARHIATRRMEDEANAMGADAIEALRYVTAAVMDGASEVMVYGTAVKFTQGN